MTESGELYLVENIMYVSILNHDTKPHKEIGNRKVIIETGEIIEFRYSYGVHFRTRDDKWFYVDEETFKKHCILFGEIFPEIRGKNVATLDEILRLDLYKLKLDMENRCHKCYLVKKECSGQLCKRWCDDCDKKMMEMKK